MLISLIAALTSGALMLGSPAVASPAKGCWETSVRGAVGESSGGTTAMSLRLVFYGDKRAADSLMLIDLNGDEYSSDVFCKNHRCQLMDDGGSFELVPAKGGFTMKAKGSWIAQRENQLVRLRALGKAKVHTLTLVAAPLQVCADLQQRMAEQLESF